MRVFGNSDCQRRMTGLVDEGLEGVFFIHGPCALGKRTFLESLVARSHGGLSVASTVDGVRALKSTVSIMPVEDDVHDVVVMDVDRMAAPAQDACLKLVEEPPPRGRIWLHAHDVGAVGPALRSRLRNEFRWTTVSHDEMLEFALSLGPVDEFSLSAAKGRPGLYATMRLDPRFSGLHDALSSFMDGRRNLLTEPLPVLLSDLDADSPLREPVGTILSCVAKSFLPRGLPLLALASKIVSNASLNVELHWFTTMASISPLKAVLSVI